MSEAGQNEEVAEMYSNLGLEVGDVLGLACIILECQADWWLNCHAQDYRPPPPTEVTFFGRPSELGPEAQSVLREVAALLSQARWHVFGEALTRLPYSQLSLSEEVGSRRLAAAALLRDGWQPETTTGGAP